VRATQVERGDGSGLGARERLAQACRSTAERARLVGGEHAVASLDLENREPEDYQHISGDLASLSGLVEDRGFGRMEKGVRSTIFARGSASIGGGQSAA